jgi:hypothetical protein
MITDSSVESDRHQQGLLGRMLGLIMIRMTRRYESLRDLDGSHS